MGFMERLGYVKKRRYEEVVRERDNLRRRIAELEDDIRMVDKLKKTVEFLKIAVPSIRKIKNIGPRTAEKLEARGIKNIVDLIEASPEKIIEATGGSKENALQLIKKATNLLRKQA